MASDSDDFMDDAESGYEDDDTNAPAAKPKGKKKTVEEIYQKKTQLEHILLRPDTYSEYFKDVARRVRFTTLSNSFVCSPLLPQLGPSNVSRSPCSS